MDRSIIAQALGDTPIKEFRYFDTIGSTNDEAQLWADAGAPDFALVVADEQIKGRGRFSRRWVTNPGSSLALSLILHPNPSEIQKLAMFAPLCGLALRDVLHSRLGLNAEIKWPNDVLLSAKKTAGILVEAVWSGERVVGLVLGIGINITHSSLPPSNGQLFPATCLEDELGYPIDRLSLLVDLINSLASWRELLGTITFIEEWQKHLAFKGQPVRIEDSQKTSIIGTVKGIDTNGNLVLILENGSERDFAAGDVHLRPIDTDFAGGK
jgi:BirA family transcriptional regulator, biotin operon repressor / biotin---[acetyl-CoA-carboxylase] ligase